MRTTASLLLGLSLVGLLGCGEVEKPSPHLIVSGSRDLAPLLAEAARRFHESHPGLTVDVDPASERGGADARTGLADVGALARPLRPDETALYAVAIGRDGIAFVVHRDNPVRSLDDSQLAGLFSGAHANWKEVGGPDLAVVPVGLAEGRQLRDTVLGYFGLASNRFRSDSAVYTSEQVLEAVAARPGAIGYASLGKAEAASAKQPIRLLPLRAVPATLAEVRAGRYPLTRPLLLLTRQRPEGAVKEFISFACSDEMRDLLEQEGFLPVEARCSPEAARKGEGEKP